MVHIFYEKKFFKGCLLASTTICLVAGIFMLIHGIVLSNPENTYAKLLEFEPFDIRIMETNAILATSVFSIVFSLIVCITCIHAFLIVASWEDLSIKNHSIVLVINICIGISYLFFAGFFPALEIIKNELKSTSISNFSSQDITFKNDHVVIPSSVQDIAWAKTQFEAECCGVYGPQDYSNLTENQRTQKIQGVIKILMMPLSCCKTKISGHIAYNVNDFADFQGCIEGNYSAAYDKPCFQVVYMYDRLCYQIAMSLGWIIVIFEVVSFTMTILYQKGVYSEIID